jgi:hypothetical protein
MLVSGARKSHRVIPPTLKRCAWRRIRPYFKRCLQIERRNYAYVTQAIEGTYSAATKGN